MENCTFCGKSVIRLNRHQGFCKLNPNRRPFGKGGANQFTKAKAEGVDYVPSTKEVEGWKRSGIARNVIRWGKEGAREEMSLKIREAIKRNPDSYSTSNVSGRSKIYEFKGSKLKGTWELTFAKWLEENNIAWTNDLKGIEYEWNNSTHFYFPDFYLSSLDIYVEVKGYVRERDLCKWKAVKNLVVIAKNEINSIHKGTYTYSQFSAVVQRLEREIHNL